MARVDMHCHSKYSDKTQNWYLNRIDARECYTEPEELYRRQKAAGMDYVTITDHDVIDGALELAERYDDAFVSCELTVTFPHDGLTTHLCLYDITEAQYNMGMKLAKNVRDVAAYFREQQVLMSLPHPLHVGFDPLTPEHLEQLVLLFENFEEINGLQFGTANTMQSDLLERLSPLLIERLSRKHGIKPAFERPWFKGRTSGSDAHSSIFLGRAWTEVEGATSLREFLDGIHRRESTAHGMSIDATMFSHAALGNTAQHIERLQGHSAEGSWEERMTGVVNRFIGSAEGAQEAVADVLKSALALWDPESHQGEANFGTLTDTSFDLVNEGFNTLVSQAFAKSWPMLCEGRIGDGFAQLALLAPAAAIATPYIASYKHLYGSDDYQRRCAEAFQIPNRVDGPEQKWAWFTDTISDINGVARTIQTVAQLADKHGTPITAITSVADAPDFSGHLHNFKPLTRFKIPEYEFMSISLPPLLEMLRYCHEQRFTRFVISTPGPVGLFALFIAKLLGVKTAAIYHTDLPRYTLALTGKPVLEQMAWKLVRLLYGKVDHVYALAEASRQELQRNGLAHKKISIFPKGIDVDQFHPSRRDRSIWNRWNLNGKTKIIYVGRVSREKGLDVLTAAFDRIARQRDDVELVVVGDGPYLEELKQRWEDTDGVVFTGFVEGESLAQMYASADIFAFPSTTDTYGTAVLEAQASGLAAVVTDMGGPKNVIVDGKTGIVAESDSVESFADVLLRLVEDEPTRKQMGKAGRRHVEDRTWESAIQSFWNEEAVKPNDAPATQTPNVTVDSGDVPVAVKVPVVSSAG